MNDSGGAGRVSGGNEHMQVGGRAARSPQGANVEDTSLQLCLLDRFQLFDRGVEVELGAGSQRLLALVALRPSGIRRDLLAGILWPVVSDKCAHTCLRSALLRLARVAPRALRTTAVDVSVADCATVDFRSARCLAERLVLQSPETVLDVAVTEIPSLSADLLPGWYEEWVLREAESWRQLRLHALEVLALKLCENHRFPEASVAASAAIAADPLRETARAAMIRVHLAEGNRSEALREFDQFELQLDRELGTRPTECLRGLLASTGS